MTTIFPIRVQHYGDDALLATYDKAAADIHRHLQARADLLRKNPLWLDVVPGLASITVRYNLRITAPDDAMKIFINSFRDPIRSLRRIPTEIVIPVCYDAPYAPDLANISHNLGISTEELITRHTQPQYTIAFLGFTPGFCYLVGLDPRLNVPRLQTPRQQVPAGSIGMAQSQSSVYGLAGPGGWPLIGQTPLTLFNPTAKNPFHLSPGSTVRFNRISAPEFDDYQKAQHQ